MTNSLRHEFHSDISSMILNEIQYNRANYYYFLGKVESWGIGDTAPNTVIPDSDLENILIRSNALFVRKITPNDASLVTTRYNWEYQEVFDQWDNTQNMTNKKFYCLTLENNVYKCLNNNDGGQSVVNPTGESSYPFKTADGYLWKYMYTIPTFKRSRFMTFTHIPVQKSLTNSFYNKGSADDVAIVNSGSGYLDVQQTFINVSGTTSGSGAVATIIAGPTGNITGFNITNGGTGYTAGVAITFTSTHGSGGTATAVISGGIITGITILTAGLLYLTGESVVFSVGGAVIIPSVSRITGTIEKVTIVNPGAGYTATPSLSVTSLTAFGTGKYGNATALVEAVLFEGKIVNVAIIDPGIQYPTDTDTTIVVLGNGSDAAFSPVVYLGTVIDVVVDNPGFGYTEMGLTVVGNGTGAQLSAIISASDYTSKQSIIEQSAIPGAVYAIEITAGGNNYTSTTTCTISGDGVGCTATPVVFNGQVTRILVDTYGENYTHATVTFFDPNRGSVIPITEAEAYIVIPPAGGHGFDAVAELYGKTIAINSSLRQELELNQLNQDYRQFGIIKNPTKFLSGELFTSSSALITYKLTFTNVTNLMVDENLLMNNIKYRVVAINLNTVYLQQLGNTFNLPIGILTAEVENTRSYTTTEVLVSPAVNKYSGKLLYVSNENPFSFTEDQGIIIKTFLTF